MTIKATILGSGSSGGVPRIDGEWGACDPTNPKNRRRRCSLLLQSDDVTVLIDTSPDMREQLLDADVSMVDAVFFTHDHADQAHGIDDLRGFVLVKRALIDVYAAPQTADGLMKRFGYCFEKVFNYPPILRLSRLGDAAVEVSASIPGKTGTLALQPFTVQHGDIDALGFRCGDLAYIPDVSALPDAAFQHLANLDLLIIDALRYRPHPSHAHVEQSLAWIAELKPKHAVLTNLHHDLDYNTLRDELPAGVVPAYDGLTIEI